MALESSKSKSRIPYIPGTKPSIKNAQLLVSTGIPSLDYTIGGGLPIGSIFLIEEDIYGTYAHAMQKYFIAEGIVSSHPLLIASQDTEITTLLSEIPAPITDTASELNVQSMDDRMKIAWRYQNLRTVDSSPMGGRIFGHFYDLTKSMDKKVIDNANITQWDKPMKNIMKNSVFENPAYEDLLKTVAKTLKSGMFFTSDEPDKRNVLRISINSLGSRMWFCDSEESTHADMFKFLYCFRALLRNSFAVAFISCPTQNFDNYDNMVERLEHLSDFAIRLESFAGSSKETNPLFKDYHGLLHIKKLPALNILAPHTPESRDLVFKLRRKKLLIEILHLPPEFGDTTQREQDEMSTSGCLTSGKKNLLEF
ncbi:PREDICTED: elongator complex protein 4 [Polistes dominula]|uniref:Elongator complex protein 4 n=1 Tax=Polistes dominula TaxID=743375 RepID=A0ABM1HZB3_POLDO|nr:PREDICTED: elongator complex protein 4 [Polistes dominula]XP_015173300.1 PREDICTED: elongator complex protein 4 [Polistes dominula]